jgi:hypothetical protein
MKGAVLAGLLLSVVPALGGTKNYPLEFQVLFADRAPGDLGHLGSCSMQLRSENRIFTVGVEDTFHPCVIFAPGTILRGSENHAISASVDLLDESGTKPKVHRYWVRDVELVSR